MKEKIKITEKINNFKKNHVKGIKVAEKIGVCFIAAVAFGTIGYTIGSKFSSDIADISSEATETGTEILEDVAEAVA